MARVAPSRAAVAAIKQSASSSVRRRSRCLKLPASSATARVTGRMTRPSSSAFVASLSPGRIPAWTSATEIAEQHGTDSRVAARRNSRVAGRPRRRSMRTSESSRSLLTRCAAAATGGHDGRTPASPGQARGAWTPSRHQSFPRRPCGTSSASARAATPLRPPGFARPSERRGAARRAESSGSMKFACFMAGRTRVPSCVLHEHLQSDIVRANPPTEVSRTAVGHGGSPPPGRTNRWPRRSCSSRTTR